MHSLIIPMLLWLPLLQCCIWHCSPRSHPRDHCADSDEHCQCQPGQDCQPGGAEWSSKINWHNGTDPAIKNILLLLLFLHFTGLAPATSGKGAPKSSVCQIAPDCSLLCCRNLFYQISKLLCLFVTSWSLIKQDFTRTVDAKSAILQINDCLTQYLYVFLSYCDTYQ